MRHEATAKRHLLKCAGAATVLLFQGVLVHVWAQPVSETNQSAFNPRQQKSIALEQDGNRIELVLSEPFRIKVSNGGAGTRREVTLPPELVQVDSLQAVGTARVAVFGRVNGTVSQVVVIDQKSGSLVDSFLCYLPTLSPDHQLLAYAMFFPPHFVEGPSYEYMLYDFRKSAVRNRPPGMAADDPQRAGRTLYPPLPPGQPVRLNTGVPEDQAHFLVSGFCWAPNSRTVGFVDQMHRGLTLVRIDIPFEGQGDYQVYKADLDYPPECEGEGQPCPVRVWQMDFSSEHEGVRLALTARYVTQKTRTFIDIAPRRMIRIY